MDYQETLTVIILNYQGEKLLTNNLPAVIRAVKNSPVKTRLVVADNKSTDNSRAVVAQFKDVQWLGFDKNFGFGKGNNLAVSKINSDYILLLNNDINPQENFIAPLLEKIKEKDVFAVSCRQKIIQQGKVFYSGGTIGEWKRGLLRHLPIEQVYPKPLKAVKSFYASGGASIYNRQKFIKLGGFSQVFAPFYWEDADLSFRAWRVGWSSWYQPASQVIHGHETTIAALNSKFKKQAIGWRGIFIFTWRAIDCWQLFLSHLFWLPFHLLFNLITFRFDRIYGWLLALPRIFNRIPSKDNKNSTLDIIRISKQE